MAASERGRKQACALEPRADWRRAVKLCAATGEMQILLNAGFGIDHLSDPAEAVARAIRGIRLGAEELGALGRDLTVASITVRAVRTPHTPTLEGLTSDLRSLRELTEELTLAIGARGELLDTASSELRRVRRALLQSLDAARARATAIASSSRLAKALQDTIVTQRDDRFVLPVKAEFAHLVPGIVHDSSASGQTVFVEPLGVLELNNHCRTLQFDEQREIQRILARLSSRIAEEAASINHLMTVVTELDLAYARARLASEMRAQAPIFVAEPSIILIDARHPLLGLRAVPQSLHLDESCRLIIISGPNMGGKTVALKLVALSVLMAACGLYLPAEYGTTIGAFTKVIADVGDAQSIATDTSTFAAHLRRLREILANAHHGLLYVVDEIASGTENAAGAALAMAILDELLANGAHGIVTTHAQELKVYAQEHPGIVNAGMRFTPENHEPSFELDLGVPGRSLALDLARREGFDPVLLDKARQRIGDQEAHYDHALAELSAARSELDQAKRKLVEETVAQAVLRRTLEHEQHAFEKQREVFLETSQQKLIQTLEAFAAELRARAPQNIRRVGRTQTELFARHAGSLRENFAGSRQREPMAIQEQLTIEMQVGVRGFEGIATIAELRSDEVVVSFGVMRMSVSYQDIIQRPASHLTTKPKKKYGVSRFEQRNTTQVDEPVPYVQTASMEIDVRGKRLHEAQPLVERWLEQALMAGVSPIRLIHGKGTGQLGQGLQELLRDHANVSALRYGNENEGGGGVTILSLR